MPLHFVLVCSLMLTSIEEVASWSYHEAAHWGHHYPSCDGRRQSPVDLASKALIPDDSLTNFSFTNFDTYAGVNTVITNNGHSVQVTYSAGDLRVRGGGLRDEYSVAQYHFHWGSVDTQGSEHTVDGKAYPMEMHVVTYNRFYGSLENAAKHPEGLAVLGFFFEIAPEENLAWAPLINSLPRVTDPTTEFDLKEVPLAKLLPDDISEYYRYDGGLTTPPCSEVVTWTVFRQPIRISAKQMAAFRKLKSSDLDPAGNALPLVDNFRPVQDLNDRTISTNFRATTMIG